MIYVGSREIEKKLISLSDEFYSGKQTAVDIRVNVIVEGQENNIVSQYIIFCKVVDSLVREKGRSTATMREAIRICKDRNVLREYLESHEKEAVDMLMELYDQERITDRMLASTRREQKEETTLENIKKLMANLKLTAEQAMEDVTLPLSSVLSKYAGMPVDTSLYVRKSHIRMFKDAGYSDRRARDFAVVLGVMANIYKLESYAFTTPYEDLYDAGETEAELTEKKNDGQSPLNHRQIPELPIADERPETDEGSTTDGNNAADARIESLEKDLKQARKENQSYRHEISTLQRELERLQHQLTERKQLEEEWVEIEKEEAPEIKYPYRTKLKVVVYGGFDVFHRELKKLLPDVRIVETSSHIDVKPFQNADIVFLQINKTDHSGYYAVCDTCKTSGVPYIHLNYAGAKRCADVMVREICRWKNGRTYGKTDN